MDSQEQTSRTGLLEPFADAQRGLPLLGWLVWWSIPKDVEIPLLELEQKLDAVGLSRDILPAIQARSALTTALQRLETKDLIRRVTADSEKIVFALVAENVDSAALQIDFSQVQTVIFLKERKELEFKNATHVETISELFEKYRVTITASRLRSVIRRVFEQGDPVTVRDAMLFVPRQRAELVETVLALLALIGQGSSLSRLGLVDSVETRGTMLQVVRKELDQEIDAASKELEELSNQDTVRPATVTHRLKNYRALRAKVEGYAELLTFSAGKLLERLISLEEQVQYLV